MKININVPNKTAYALIALIVVLFLGVGVYAAVDKDGAWHSAAEIQVDIDGDPKSLQDAIADGDIAGKVDGLHERDDDDCTWRRGKKSGDAYSKSKNAYIDRMGAATCNDGEYAAGVKLKSTGSNLYIAAYCCPVK